MHESVMAFVRSCMPRVKVKGQEVLEVGSRNVNGSVREIIEPQQPGSYLGVDMISGPGVDMEVDMTADEFFLTSTYDLVICTEMLEHVSDWKLAVTRMKACVKTGGDLIITTRAPGFPLHEYPGDYWRFTIKMFLEIFDDMHICKLEPDPQVPGVFFHGVATKRTGLADLDHINAIPMEKKAG